MKPWMMLMVLCASVAIADEPPQPPPVPPDTTQPEPELTLEPVPVERPPVDAPRPDVPQTEAPRPDAPRPLGPPMDQPPGLPPGVLPPDAETIVFEADEAALNAPAPVEPGTQPVSLPTTTAATVPTTGLSTTQPATMQVATTEPTTVPSTGPTASTGPTTAPGYSRSGYSRDSRFTARVAPPAPTRVVPVPKPLPVEFAVLNSRSFFVHGRMVVETPRDPRLGPGGSGRVDVVDKPLPVRPEKTMLFNGSTRADGEWVALIEDTVAAKIVKVSVGDSLAQGKVAAITLNTLDYDAGGKIRQISLGQNLDGESISGATTRPALAGGTPTSGPAAPGGSGGGGGLSDILERLRQKRMQELGGK